MKGLNRTYPVVVILGTGRCGFAFFSSDVN